LAKFDDIWKTEMARSGGQGMGKAIAPMGTMVYLMKTDDMMADIQFSELAQEPHIQCTVRLRESWRALTDAERRNVLLAKCIWDLDDGLFEKLEKRVAKNHELFAVFKGLQELANHLLVSAKWVPERVALCKDDGWVLKSIEHISNEPGIGKSPLAADAMDLAMPILKEHEPPGYRKAMDTAKPATGSGRNPHVTTILVSGWTSHADRKTHEAFEHEDGWMYARGADVFPVFAGALRLSSENKQPLYHFALDPSVRNIRGKIVSELAEGKDQVTWKKLTNKFQHDDSDLTFDPSKPLIKPLDIAEIAHSNRQFKNNPTVLVLGGHGTDDGKFAVDNRDSELDSDTLASLVVNLMKAVVGEGQLLVVVDMCHSGKLVKSTKERLQEAAKLDSVDEVESKLRVSFWAGTCPEFVSLAKSGMPRDMMLTREAFIKLGKSDLENKDKFTCGENDPIPNLKDIVNTVGKGYTDCTRTCGQDGVCTTGHSESKVPLGEWKLTSKRLRVVVERGEALEKDVRETIEEFFFPNNRDERSFQVPDL
jgi:hypothetical protein